MTHTSAYCRAVARPAAPACAPAGGRTAGRALIHCGSAVAARSSGPAFPRGCGLRHLTHCTYRSRTCQQKTRFPHVYPPRQPRCCLLAMPAEPRGLRAGRHTGQRHPRPGTSGAPDPPPHSRKPHTKRNKGYVHAIPLLPGDVAAYLGSSSRPPGHLRSYKSPPGVLGWPQRSGAAGVPAPVYQQD